MEIKKKFFAILASFLMLFLSVKISYSAPPIPSFQTDPGSGAPSAPVGVQFSDTSTDNPTWWLWQFGDGYFSLEQHPTHFYQESGTYPVTLNVANAEGLDMVTADFTVQACANSYKALLMDEGLYFDTITEAYSSAIALQKNPFAIGIKAGTIDENLYLDADASVDLIGGFDCSFGNSYMESAIQSLTIAGGMVNPSYLRITSATSGIRELCDGIDNDGDGQVDEDLLSPPCWHQEGVCSGSVQVCLGALGWSGADSFECNSNNQNYEATEATCDGLDNDCDGQIDEGFSPIDDDGDGFSSLLSCLGSADDCDDNDPNIFPGNPEICDGKDNNCSGVADEGLTFDVDGDGFTSIGSCTGSADDCDDHNAGINPAATEFYGDWIDQNCDGVELLAVADYECFDCHAWEPPLLIKLNTVHTNCSAPDTTCVNCHAAFVENILPAHYGRTVKTAGNNMESGQVITCKSCHDRDDGEDHSGANMVWPKVTIVGKGNETCDTCHEDRLTLHSSDTVHVHRLPVASCGECHSIATNEDIDTLHRADCFTCHNYTGTKLDPNVVEQAIVDGAAGTDITCNTCHGAIFYSIHPDTIDHTSIITTGTTICGLCHVGQPPLVDPFDQKVHDACSTCHDTDGVLINLAEDQSFDPGGDCTTCHGDHFPDHLHHYTTDNDVSYDDTVDISQARQQGCGVCHRDYDTVNGTLLSLTTWEAILFEHDNDGTKDGSGNTCVNCHTYDGNGSPPLDTVQGAINSGNPATCATCHTEKMGASDHYTPITGKHPEHLALPDIGCDTCHNITFYPNFKSGTDLNGDNLYNLLETDVCDDCHKASW